MMDVAGLTEKIVVIKNIEKLLTFEEVEKCQIITAKEFAIHAILVNKSDRLFIKEIKLF